MYAKSTFVYLKQEKITYLRATKFILFKMKATIHFLYRDMFHERTSLVHEKALEIFLLQLSYISRC